jgi:hypothetical protein
MDSAWITEVIFLLFIVSCQRAKTTHPACKTNRIIKYYYVS